MPSPALDIRLHSGTPAITVHDSRALVVRTVEYHRLRADEQADARISLHGYHASGLLSHSIDPRFAGALAQDARERLRHGPDKNSDDKTDKKSDNKTHGKSNNQIVTKLGIHANCRWQHSLSGRVLRSDCIDAGWTTQLCSVAGQPTLQHDARHTVRRWQYEQHMTGLGRITAVMEHLDGEAERVIERFCYADHDAAYSERNLRGRLIRHYDPAGLHSLLGSSLAGQILAQRQQLRLLTDTAVAPDWRCDGGGENGTNAGLIGQSSLEQTHYESRFSYDASGLPLTMRDAMHNVQRQEYGVDGRLKLSWLTPAGQEPIQTIRLLAYTAAGQSLLEEGGNGVATRWCHDPRTLRIDSVAVSRGAVATTAENRVETPATQARGKTLQHLHYEYDPAGHVLLVRDAAQARQFYRNQAVLPERRYRYDTLYQLIGASGRESAANHAQSERIGTPSADASQRAGFMRHFRYDRAGNLSEIQHSGATHYKTTMAVSPACNRSAVVRSAAAPRDVDALFDAAGNLRVLDSGQRLQWDTRDQLNQVSAMPRGEEGDDREFYRYRGNGMRMVKTVVRQTSATTTTLRVIYLPGLELHRRCTGKRPIESWQVIKSGGAGRLGVRHVHWELGRPAQLDGDQLRYGYREPTGWSQLETDEHGNLVSREEFFPYGGTALWASPNEIEAKYKTVRYSGKERDATGLYYYGYRYYVPWSGRWLNADPAGSADGLNSYRMAKNDPVNFVDPDGRQAVHVLYAEAFQAVANRYGVILGLRAPNPLSEGLLLAGMASKNFHVKAKSSATGPTAAYIAVNPEYSKVPRAKFPKQASAVAAALAAGASAVPLVLDATRMAHLLESGHMVHTGGDTYSAKYGETTHSFKIDSGGNVSDSAGAVEVLTNPPEKGKPMTNGGPITADVDLFTIIPRANQAGNARPLISAPVLRRGNWTSDDLAFLQKRASRAGATEDPNMGNLHFFGQTIVKALNQEIAKAGFTGGNLVWHNDETGNPFSPGFDAADKPIFFTPHRNGINTPVQQAGSAHEISGLYDQFRRQGYAPEYSPVFGW